MAQQHTAAGRLIADLYCSGCSFYSGGGLCRVCQRGNAAFIPPVPTVNSATGIDIHVVTETR